MNVKKASEASSPNLPSLLVIPIFILLFVLGDIFDKISYDKGAALIQMLSNHIGMVKFRESLRHYMNEHKYKSVTVIVRFATNRSILILVSYLFSLRIYCNRLSPRRLRTCPSRRSCWIGSIAYLASDHYSYSVTKCCRCCASLDFPSSRRACTMTVSPLSSIRLATYPWAPRQRSLAKRVHGYPSQSAYLFSSTVIIRR